MAKTKSIGEWFSYWHKAKFKQRVYRFLVRWRRFKKKHFKSIKPEIDETQKKAIQLFFTLMKYKDANLTHSPQSSTRIIETDFVWITVISGLNAYVMNIIDETIQESPHSHQISIPKEYGFELIDEFDYELERRFRDVETNKRKVIVDDLDKLILKTNNIKTK